MPAFFRNTRGTLAETPNPMLTAQPAFQLLCDPPGDDFLHPERGQLKAVQGPDHLAEIAGS